MTPRELRNSILQYAIQGKLVEQRHEEGTGEELYIKILAHKKTLFNGKKEGKLSSEQIKEDEILFDIPSTWKWVRFGHIMINRDAERIPLSVDERETLAKVYDYYGASGVIDKVDNYLFDKKLLLIGEDGANLLTRSTPIAFLAQGKYWVNNHAHVLDCNENLLCMEYVMWFINAINLAPYVTGTAQPKMNQQKMNSIPVALPPFAEQKRIVARIEEILPLIDRYEAAWNKLEEFNKRFPGDMQKSILQLAIQGKLVEQRPEEGTGKELFQQIQAEKQVLVKAGKIKKEKPMSKITEEEIPFDIPESWKWVRLRSLGVFSSGKTPTMGIVENWDNGTVSWITSKDMKKKYLSSSEMLITEKAASEMKVYPENTVLMVVRSGILKRLLPVAILTGESTINQDVKALSLHMSGISEFVYVILKGMETHILKEYRKQVTTVDSLRFEDFQNMPVPLPPLAEQNRIVAKLEEILPLCERLK